MNIKKKSLTAAILAGMLVSAFLAIKGFIWIGYFVAGHDGTVVSDKAGAFWVGLASVFFGSFILAFAFCILSFAWVIADQLREKLTDWRRQQIHPGVI